MGAQIDAGGSRRARRSLAEINVTPLVDVMLVLLIISMVAAPMLQRGINLELPATESASEIQE
ncbi:MAG: protein TolR, partial [Gemmatimonadetes bacterium]|nr:protein TolR [Gemmatimonadota bacterium]